MTESKTSDQQNNQGEKQFEKDQAAAGESGVEEGQEEGTTEEATEEEEEGEGEESDEDEDEDEAPSEDELKGLPANLRKAVTSKFQRAAAIRKELRPYQNLIKSLNENGKATVEALAQQFGIEIVKPKGKDEEAVQSVADQVASAVAEALGEEYSDLTPKLAKAIHKAAELVAKDRLKETDSRLNEVVSDAALQEANLTMAAMDEKHPGWKKFETRMVELSQRMPPGKDMDQLEYTENLYYLASREGAQGDKVKKVVKQMQKSAKEGVKADTTVDSKVVKLAPGKLPTFAEAAAAARRGETLE